MLFYLHRDTLTSFRTQRLAFWVYGTPQLPSLPLCRSSQCTAPPPRPKIRWGMSRTIGPISNAFLIFSESFFLDFPEKMLINSYCSNPRAPCCRALKIRPTLKDPWRLPCWPISRAVRWRLWWCGPTECRDDGLPVWHIGHIFVFVARREKVVLVGGRLVGNWDKTSLLF